MSGLQCSTDLDATLRDISSALMTPRCSGEKNSAFNFDVLMTLDKLVPLVCFTWRKLGIYKLGLIIRIIVNQF